tara:strand:+ start:658 stop:1275 length:618 start_codon:yes stop_codon:yes gene_type:complete
MNLFKQIAIPQSTKPFGFNQVSTFNLAGTGKLGRFNSDVSLKTFETQSRPPKHPFISAHLNFLYENGYKHLVCLDQKNTDLIQTSWKLFSNSTFTVFEITKSTPRKTMFNQFKTFSELVNNNTNTSKVCVFCFAGLGRTGTFLTAYVLYNSLSNSNTKPAQNTVKNAINFIRENYRLEAVEFDWQEDLLRDWITYLKDQNSTSRV